MALPDLTGQNIENTYQRVLQTDGINVYDGTGSLVTLQSVSVPFEFKSTDLYSTTSSLEITGSVSIANTLTVEDNLIVRDGNTFAILIDTNFGSLTDISGNPSIDWFNRQQYDGGGATSVDYGSRQLIDPTAAVSIDYEKRRQYDSSGVASIDYEVGQQYDSSGITSIDYRGREQYDGTGIPSINYDTRRLYDFNATRSLDWAGRRAYDLNDVISFNWRDRLLQTPNGSAILDWNTNGTAKILGSLVVTGSLDVTGSAFIRNLASTAQTSVVTINAATGQLFLTASSALGGGGATVKAGAVSSASFGGSPFTSSVTFGTAYGDTQYAVTLTGEDDRIYVVNSKQTTGFIINTNSSTLFTGSVYWIATPYYNS
jgi:hypothetical protein